MNMLFFLLATCPLLVSATEYRERVLPPGIADWHYAMEYTDVFGVVFRGNYNFLSVDPTTLKVSAQGHIYHHGRQPTDPYTLLYQARTSDGNIQFKLMTNLDKYLCLNKELRVNVMDFEKERCTFRLVMVGQQGSSDVYYNTHTNCTISLSVNSGKPKVNCFPGPPSLPPKSVVFDRVRPRIETILQFTTIYRQVYPELQDSSKIVEFTYQKISTRSKVHLVDWQTGETRKEYFRFPNTFSFLKQLEYAEFDLTPPYIDQIQSRETRRDPVISGTLRDDSTRSNQQIKADRTLPETLRKELDHGNGNEM